MIRVTLSEGPAGPLARAVLAAAPETVADALHLAETLGSSRPFVGQGSSLDLWEALATLAGHDVALARAVEPHIDALTILDQAEVRPSSSGTWGVFAAEAPGARLEAVEGDDGWSLSGEKPWCSLAGTLTDALVTAWVSGTERRLFRVHLDQPGVRVLDGEWYARGLQEIPSGTVDFTSTPATPVGSAGWYLTRPGFAWGGISVAACWYGGAVGLSRALLAAARRPGKEGDDILLMHLGVVDARLAEAGGALAEAARLVDAGDDGALLVKRVRSTVARCAEDVLARVGHALGPAPLAHDAQHAKRVADLGLYLRQHHGERDDVSLGRSVRDSRTEW